MLARHPALDANHDDDYDDDDDCLDNGDVDSNYYEDD